MKETIIIKKLMEMLNDVMKLMLSGNDMMKISYHSEQLKHSTKDLIKETLDFYSNIVKQQQGEERAKLFLKMVKDHVIQQSPEAAEFFDF